MRMAEPDSAALYCHSGRAPPPRFPKHELHRQVLLGPAAAASVSPPLMANPIVHNDSVAMTTRGSVDIVAWRPASRLHTVQLGGAAGGEDS